MGRETEGPSPDSLSKSFEVQYEGIEVEMKSSIKIGTRKG